MNGRPRSKRALAFGTTLLWALAPAFAQDQNPGASLLEALQEQVQRVGKRCHGAIVRIEARDKHGQLAGTGFFVDPTGTLYTSYTIGGDTHDIVVMIDDARHPARRLCADERSGVALLKVEAKTPFLCVGTSYDMAVGAPVMALGYPMDLPLTPSFGLLGGFDRKYLGRYFATTHLRANLSVQRGEGGAPLLNMKGEVVGILISSLDQGSASFALPIEAAEKVRRDWVRFETVRPGWLGISVVTAAEAKEGSTAVIEEVFPNAPAAKAGVKPSDVLLAVGGRRITSPEDMMDACFFLSADETVTLRVARDGQELQLHALTAEHPARNMPSRGLNLTDAAPAVPGETLKIGE